MKAITVPSGARHIAVLFHRAEPREGLGSYIVDHLARFWREDGHRVTYLFGSGRFVPADLVLVHVNLSVVPDAYLDLAMRYPIAVNGRIRDIRKSTISRNLLRPGDAWPGPVIVKSDLNYGGIPERMLRESWLQRRFEPWKALTRRVARLRGREPPFAGNDYPVFDKLADVPERWFRHRQVVVERFRPELDNGLYHLRMYQFLGDRAIATRLASREPIMKAHNSIGVERIEPDPGIVRWREALGMDYGKLDYVVDRGEVVLLDANKTTGASRHLEDSALVAMRRHLAQGLYAFFREPGSAPQAPTARASRTYGTDTGS